MRTPAGADNESVEVLEDEAQTEAALESLMLVRDDGSLPVRIILAVDIRDDDIREDKNSDHEVSPGITRILPADFSWEDVRAILIDEADAMPDVTSCVHATTQEEADTAVAQLWERSLLWFDGEERSALVQSLNS